MKKHLTFVFSVIFILLTSNVYAMEKTQPYIPSNELMEAIDRHDVVKAKALLDAGADINHVGYTYKIKHPIPLINEREYITTIYFDTTPLSLAASEGYEDVVTMLLEYRSPNPLIAHDGILKVLLIAEQLKADGKLNPDYCFPREHTNGILKQLFAKPLAINKKNSKGETALFTQEFPYHRISDSIRKKLIDNGADVNAVDCAGTTIAMSAETKQDLATILAYKQPQLHNWSMWLRF